VSTAATPFVTATATDPAGNTSEFALDVAPVLVSIGGPAAGTAGSQINLTSTVTVPTTNPNFT
jgi:hypothetical protein